MRERRLTVVGIYEVLQWHGIPRSVTIPLYRGARRAAVRLEGHGRDDPRADRRGEVLGRERTERHVFPLLHVPGAPVVHQDVSEYPVLGLLGVHGPADRISIFPAIGMGVAIAAANALDVRATPDDERDLQFEIERPRRAVFAPPFGIGRVDHHLSARTTHPPRSTSARDVYAAGPAVVPDGHVEPIGLQRVVLASEHDAHVRGVLPRRVEVGVIPDRARQVMMHNRGRNGAEGGVSQRGVGPQTIVGLDRRRRRSAVVVVVVVVVVEEEEAYETIAHGDPRPSLAPEEGVEVRHREDDAGMEVVVEEEVVEESRLGEEVQVDDDVPHRRAAPRRRRVDGAHDDVFGRCIIIDDDDGGGGGEGADAEGDVEQPEIGVGWDVQPRRRRRRRRRRRFHPSRG
jgi:hypothetical protein